MYNPYGTVIIELLGMEAQCKREMKCDIGGRDARRLGGDEVDKMHNNRNRECMRSREKCSDKSWYVMQVVFPDRRPTAEKKR